MGKEGVSEGSGQDFLAGKNGDRHAGRQAQSRSQERNGWG